MIHVGEADPCFRQAIIDRVGGISVVVFFSGEALLLGGCDNAAVFDQRGRAVMIKGRNTQDAH